MSNAPATLDAKAPARRGRGPLSGDKLRLGMLLTAAVVFAGGFAYWLTRPVKRTPAEQVSTALKLLDTGKFAQAREIAKRLEAQRYRHPGFAGVLEFTQGMATFGMIEASGEAGERAQYQLVISFLREAERLALGKDRRPEWCYALGKSLYHVEQSSTARPLLEEALEDYPAARAAIAEMLIDLYLDPGIRTPELLQRALELNNEVQAAPALELRQKDVAYFQRAEIFLAMERFAEAAAALEKLSADMVRSDLSRILQARILLDQDQHVPAMEILKPIAMHDRLGESHAQEACFLMGLAAEALWDRERSAAASGNTDAEANASQYANEAEQFFKRTSERYAGTQEATAANLHLGRLWRLANSEENALQHYGTALRTMSGVGSVENFRNRWLSLGEFRQAIMEAWNGWLEARHFPEAIALSEMMTPLFPGEEAYEFAARAHQRWAEFIEDDLDGQTFTVRKDRVTELQRRWRSSAQAYERLATVRVSSAKYPEALWNAADQYYRGHDFARALDLINQFLATEPDRLMAAALVQRSRIELDLDLLPQALADLQHVVQAFPTDPATFTAHYLIGVCHFEQDELDEAERAWRGILMSEQLSPSAVEWRDAQVALGRLLFERGELLRREITRRSIPPEQAEQLAAYQNAAKMWQEAARFLSRHLERNPDSPRLEESRYYLGKALQREAEWLGLQYDAAETDNARAQLQKQHDAVLEKALSQFERLRDHLIALLNGDQADDLERKLLENSVFEIPHTLFDLRRYDEAIKEYNAAINRYPQHVQTLVAYLQMGQCHRQLGRKVEARNMLQQARLLLSHKQIPDAAFLDPATNLSRAEWEAWLDRARQVH